MLIFSETILSVLVMQAVTLPSIGKDDTTEEIHISAARAPVRAADFASPVSILTAKDLEDRQITRVVDALKLLPGVAVSRSGAGGGLTQLRLRGSEANHVLVIIDGVEVNDPAAGDEFQFEHLSATEIDRIEFVRGPLSSAWGSDALAGVINIITKRGEGALSGNVYGEGGSFGTLRAGGSLRGGGDIWHFSAGADYHDETGTNASRSRASSGGEQDGYENLSLNARSGVRVSDRLTVDWSGRYVDTTSEADRVGFETGLPVDSDNVTRTEKFSSGLSASAVLVPGLVDQTVRVTYLDTVIANTADGLFDGRTSSEKWGFYADTIIRPDEDHQITVFIDHEDTDFVQRGIATSFGDPNQDRGLNVTGYGFDYVGELVGDLTANLGLRLDDNSDFGDFTSWRGGLSARVSQTGSRLFASVARGQKAPTIIERFGFFADPFQGNPGLRPERSTQYELGLEQNIGDDYSLSLTFFRARLRNEIDPFVFNPETFAFSAANVDGRSVRKGFEVAFDARLTSSFSVGGHYSFVSSREISPDGERTRELRRPKHQAFVNFKVQPVSSFGLSLDIGYTGRALDVVFAPPAFAPNIVPLDAYFLVRVAARYTVSKHVSLTARIENLLDETYEDIIGFNTPGLGAFAGLQVAF